MLIALPVLAQEDNPAEQPKAEQSSKAKGQAAPEAPPLAPDGPKPTDTDWAKPHCAKPQNHDEADLCVQWRMAKAAEDAVRLNQIQTALGVAGAILLFVTMYYTRSAAKAADDAARAARDQLHVMKVGQRPWVAYRVDLTPLSVGTIFKARTEMTNVGHSPALDVRTLILAKGVKKGNPEPQPFFEFPPQHIHVIASSGVLLPGPPITAWTSFGGGRQPVNETDAAAVTSGALVLWLVGRVEYTDTDGNRYFTMFRGIYDPALSAFVAAGVGNDAR